MRVGLAGAHALEHELHRPAHAAAPAHEAAHAAVHLDHELRGVPRELVQLVDVLGDERVELAQPLELDDREVPGIRLRAPRWAREPVLPRCFTHLGIGEVVVDVRHLLGHRIPGPHALRAAEVRDPRVGRDAGAGEHHDAFRIAHPAPHLCFAFHGDIVTR